MYSNALILVDGPRFTRVISNLVSNALKFTPKGGAVVVSASIVQVDDVPEGFKEKFTLRICVKDDGAGISKVQSFNSIHKINFL